MKCPSCFTVDYLIAVLIHSSLPRVFILVVNLKSPGSHPLSRPPNMLQLDGDSMPGQPLATPDDCLDAEAIARDDPAVQQLVKARGICDFGMVACDPWAIHNCPPTWKGRLMQVRCGAEGTASGGHEDCDVEKWCFPRARRL